MIAYISLALVKILDNIISTFKNIAMFKEWKFVSSILVIISQLLFYLVISQVISDNTFLSIIIVSVSSGLGNLLAFFINEKFKRAAKWVFIIASKNKSDIENLCSHLTKHDIKHIAMDGYTRHGEHAIHVMAFSKSKEDSRLIEGFLKNTESKFMKEII